MDKEIICIDTSVLIDFYRKKDKGKSKLVELSRMAIIPLNELEIEKASQIIISLKKQNKLIDIQDILIAATAIASDIRLFTINKKHFSRITELRMVE